MIALAIIEQIVLIFSDISHPVTINISTTYDAWFFRYLRLREGNEYVPFEAYYLLKC